MLVPYSVTVNLMEGLGVSHKNLSILHYEKNVHEKFPSLSNNKLNDNNQITKMPRYNSLYTNIKKINKLIEK